MKALTIIWLLFIFSSPVFSQDSTTVKNRLQDYKEKRIPVYNYVYKTNPFRIFWGPIPLTSEYRLISEAATDNNQSVLFGLSYLGKSLLFALLEDSINQPNQRKMQINGFRVQAAYRFYLNANEFAPSGFYVSPHFSYSSAKFTDKGLTRL